MPVPALSTRPRPSVRTITGSASPTASLPRARTCPAPSTATAASPTRSLPSPARTSRTPTMPSSSSSRSPAASSRRTTSITPTPSVGDPTPPSSTRPSPRGSSRSRRSATRSLPTTTRRTGSPTRSRRDASTTGSSTPATGPSLETASGVRPSPSGPRRTCPRWCASAASMSWPSCPASASTICTGRRSIRSRSRPRRTPAPSSAASMRCSTAGSSPVRCRTPSNTIRSRTRSALRRVFPPISSPRDWIRPAVGSIRSWCWRRRCSISLPSRTSLSMASSLPAMARRCRSG
mmetsp:Transcript_9549/g.26756  ORF Transcript_9549/g.26756 Transcript_9549/m.26756 type:complete len:291 (+) Transcript_9549:914-1786(+)